MRAESFRSEDRDSGRDHHQNFAKALTRATMAFCDLDVQIGGIGSDGDSRRMRGLNRLRVRLSERLGAGIRRERPTGDSHREHQKQDWDEEESSEAWHSSYTILL